MRSRLAVDLGTSNTIAVVQRQDEPPRSLLFDGSPILPSAVCLGDDGTLHVGRDAQRMALVEPTRFEPHPKRRIDDGTVLLGETEVPVVELLAGVLRRVTEEARQAGVADPAAAGCTVLTCPADWGAARREVLTKAARQAGLGEVRLVDEPVAAATYCLAVEQEKVADGQPLVVFDFGGGTFDVALIRRAGDSWRVLATGGLDDLGGVDVDAALVGHLGQLLELRDAEAWRRLEQPTTPPELRDRRTFWAEVRTAKEMLSRVTTAPVQVPRTDDTLHLTREELERVAGPLVARAVDETRRVLQRAGVDPAALAGIFLVGGSSRLPLVATRLHARFGVAPRVPEQPELPVAHGALLAANIVAPAPAPAADDASPTPAAWPARTPTGAWPAPAATGVLLVPPAAEAPGAPPPTAPPAAPPTASPTEPPSAPPTAPPPAWSPANATPVEAPVSPVPLPPPLAPPIGAVTVPPRRRGMRGRTRLVLALVTVGIVVLIASGGVAVLEGFRNLLREIPGATGNPLTNDLVKTTGKLSVVKKVTAPAGTSAVAGAAGADAGFYAVSAGNRTQVTGQPVDGSPAWTVDLAMYPEDLTLIVIGDLLVVDGDRSVKHGGDDARAVIDTKTRKKLWESAWANRWDVGYLGTHAIVESGHGFDLALARVDLRTGRAVWSRGGPRDLITPGEHRGQVALSWPTAKTPAGPVAAGNKFFTGSQGLRDHLHSGPDIVEVNDSEGTMAVLNSVTGKPRAQRGGVKGVTASQWTVYEGMIVTATTTNSQHALVGYRLTDLGEAWRLSAPPGARIEAVRPCGPKRICQVLSARDDQLVAVDTATGKEAWRLEAPDDWTEPDVVPTASGLLFGGSPFDFLDDACLIDFAGKKKRTYDGSHRLVANASGRLAFTNIGSDGWQVWVGTIDGDSRSPSVATTEDEGMPDAVSLARNTVVVTTKDIPTVRVLRISDLPGG